MPGMVFPNFEREAELIRLPETEMLRVAMNNSSNQIEQKKSSFVSNHCDRGDGKYNSILLGYTTVCTVQ
jgi:hypothetical protein